MLWIIAAIFYTIRPEVSQWSTHANTSTWGKRDCLKCERMLGDVHVTGGQGSFGGTTRFFWRNTFERKRMSGKLQNVHPERDINVYGYRMSKKLRIHASQSREYRSRTQSCPHAQLGLRSEIANGKIFLPISTISYCAAPCLLPNASTAGQAPSEKALRCEKRPRRQVLREEQSRNRRGKVRCRASTSTAARYGDMMSRRSSRSAVGRTRLTHFQTEVDGYEEK